MARSKAAARCSRAWECSAPRFMDWAFLKLTGVHLNLVQATLILDPIAGMWLLLTPENVAVSRKGSAEPFALNVLARGSLHLPAELAFCNNKSRCVKRSCLMTSLGPKRIDQGAQGCAVCIDECKGVAPYITPNCQKNGCLCN